jgi:hypothetical protein
VKIFYFLREVLRMAITTAKSDGDRDKDKKAAINPDKADPKKGASGGLAPEGYGTLGQTTGFDGVEGVATRSHQEEHERHVEAIKFMDSKKKVAEDIEKAKQQLAKGKVPEKSVDAKQKEAAAKKQEEIAKKKPTVAGGDVTKIDSPAAVQSAEATRKQEEKDVSTQAPAQHVVIDENKSK